MNLGQVFTKKEIADLMAGLFTLPAGSKILDPCFGNGVFIDSIMDTNKYEITGIEIDREKFVNVVKRYPNLKLINSDFLFYDFKTKIDGIIINPPYLRQEEIDNLEPYGITKNKLHDDKLYNWTDRQSNYYVYFVLKSLSILRDNGELVIIFPDTWLKTNSGLKFKKFIFENYTIENYIKPKDPFESPVLTDVAIFKIIKSKTNDKNSNIYIKDIKDNENLVKLTNQCSIRRGLTTGFNSFFINPPDFIESEYTIPFFSNTKAIKKYSICDDKTDNLLYISEENLKESEKLNQYVIETQNMIVKNEKPLTLYNKIKQNQTWFCLKTFDSRGIIFSYIIRNRMMFVLNDKNIQVSDNFYLIQSEIDYYLLLTLLNNYYTYYQLECYGKYYGNGLLKLQKYDLEKIKILNVNSITPTDTIKLKEYGMQLAASEDATKIIAEISQIISNYMDEPCEITYNNLKNIRERRLDQ